MTALAVQNVFSTSAHAYGTAQSTVVNVAPTINTPDIQDGIVYSIAQVGTRVLVGGSFTQVAAHGSSTIVSRNYILAFNASTGALDTGFVPAVDGVVQSIVAGPTADTAYVGGLFATVNGTKSKGIVLVSTVTGAIVSGWKPSALNGAVYTVRYAPGHLYIAGTFTTDATILHQGIASLNPNTGVVDSYINVQLTGHHNYTGNGGSNGAVGPRAMDISPDGTRMIIIGNFKNANGVLSDQIVMLDLGTSAGVIDPNWSTSDFSAACASGAFDTYMRGHRLLAGRQLLRHRGHRRQRQQRRRLALAVRLGQPLGDQRHRHERPPDLGRLHRQRLPALGRRSAAPPSTSAGTSAG